jgi:hypothetical protein
MPRPLLALLAAAALPAFADDRPPATAAVSYGVHAGAAAPAFEPRRRVQKAGGADIAHAVVVVRGISADGFAPAASSSPDVEAMRAVAALCRIDPRNGGAIAAGLPALPARF